MDELEPMDQEKLAAQEVYQIANSGHVNPLINQEGMVNLVWKIFNRPELFFPYPLPRPPPNA